MIELPEAVVLARQINATLVGRRISSALANASPHKFAWYTGDPAGYNALLSGKTITTAAAYGNHIEIQAGEKLLVISTPMKYHTKGDPLPKKHQLLLTFDDQSAVTCSVQMWGVLMVLPESGEGAMPDYLIGKQKPSPLSDEFTRVYFQSLVEEAGVSLSAKEFLATKQRIPGLGNGVLQDILWTARIHPKRKMGDLSDAQINSLFTSVRNVLAEMANKGGRDTERDLFDCPGGYKTVLSKNTLGTLCPTCGTAIQKEPYLGGVIYFCSRCQSVKDSMQ